MMTKPRGLSVLAYCEQVQEAVLRGRPSGGAAALDLWIADTARASLAVVFALEAKDSAALEIAEPLAERVLK